MCLDFFKKTPYSSQTALLFAANNFPGEQDDLLGCLNDQRDVGNLISTNYPKFTIEKFTDYQFTRYNFRSSIKNRIVAMKIGDILFIHYSTHGTRGKDKSEADGYKEGIYCADGNVFWDDEFKQILDLIPIGAKVIIVSDTCHAEGQTRRIRDNSYRKIKFIETDKIPPHFKKKKYIETANDRYLFFSACKEDQSSEDAMINNEYHGAFTYFWLRAWAKTRTYQEWNDWTVAYISQFNFEQVPSLYGESEEFKNQIIFT